MNTAKKIIFIHLLNDYSGSPKVLSQVIKAFQKNNHTIELYTGRSDDGFLSGLTDKHHHYFYKRFDNKYLTLLTFMFSQISLFFKLLKYRKEDIVIYANTLLPFGAGLAGKVMKKPVYYHVHETSLRPIVFKKFLRTIAQMSASKVIFVSKAVEKLESFIDIPQEVIYNALPNELICIAKKHHYSHLYDKAFNVLMICSLKIYKGVNEFITIASLCKDNSNIKFILILNAEQAEIDSFFHDKPIPPNLLLMPKQKNVTLFYKKTNLLLNLSRIDEWVETFGLTIIEGMAFGIPSIVPPVGGPAEIVQDQKEGYLISSYKTDIIANKIKDLSNNKEKCLAMSKAAKIRTEAFNEKVFEDKILKVLDE